MYRDLFGERHITTLEEVRRIATDLFRLNRRQKAYDLVLHFVVLAQGPVKEELKSLEAALLSKLIRPGFRQPPKSGKRKGKKKRR
jgi:hypothetical protein